MSRHGSHERVVTVADNPEFLEVIREEQCSPALSSVNMAAASKVNGSESNQPCYDCQCLNEQQVVKDQISPEEVENIILEREAVLRNEFQQYFDKETTELKDKFDYILHNEQIRASYMLREAHRERQEKITALQTQLECKNLAGLMYVMCAERRKSKLQKLRLIEEYTGYIRALQQILAEGQDVILELSRGYKTAARVDHEWREKMTKIIQEFQAYVYHFSGGPPETNQYIFDLPQLLKTEAPVRPDPSEDPIQREEPPKEPVVEVDDTEKPWWEQIEGESRPFVMFGDMAEFRPPQRREVLQTVKAAKTAPAKWKKYVFNEMFLRAECPNADSIKDEYPRRLPSPPTWECRAIQTDWQPSRTSLPSPRDRHTAASIDVRGNMGSILKIITSNITQPANKANLLAARDSMEITSTTKLRDRHSKHQDPSRVKIIVGNRAASMLDQLADEEEVDEEIEDIILKKEAKRESAVDEDDESLSILGSIHNDSLQVITSHRAEKDKKIHYEKVCPMKACQRLQVDSFVRSLPAYMRANPFTHFEQTYEDYEVCSPEQLEMLQQRIEEKKKREVTYDGAAEESLIDEWGEVEGVGVQTSDMSLPPCDCRVPGPTPVSSVGRIFDMGDLYPIKQTLNHIRQEFFYDGGIEFDRFKVIGQGSKETIDEASKKDFKKKRLYEIKKILKQHPSLCEIFQANTQC